MDNNYTSFLGYTLMIIETRIFCILITLDSGFLCISIIRYSEFID